MFLVHGKTRSWVLYVSRIFPPRPSNPMPPRLPLFFLASLLFPSTLPRSSAESPACLTVYREGGAPAVLQSPKCPRWSLLADDLRARSPPACHSAILQGRRPYQEDRTVCTLGLQIPFLGRTGIKEVDVGIIAVFDGHNGAEASDMASKLLLEYFLLHVRFLLDNIYSGVFKRSHESLSYEEENHLHLVPYLDKGQNLLYADSESSKWIEPAIFDSSFHNEILKESLLRTIHDIDLTFSKEALLKNLESGSTAAVVLVADDQIVAANVGDSRAFLCSEGDWRALNGRRRRKSSYVTSDGAHVGFEMANYNGPAYHVKELTEDHHPDREDERSRVEAFGGYVIEWAGVPRVNGQLAISRSIGDVHYKRYGVISTPEVTDWRSLSNNDGYIVAATDGVFEKMTTQEVCDLLLLEKLKVKSQSACAKGYNLAESIVNTAFQRGSTDNTAVVVVPLGSVGSWRETQRGCHPYPKKSTNDAVSKSLWTAEYFEHMMAKFERFLVEAKLKRLGCFYLSENLDQSMDYIFESPDAHYRDSMHDSHHMSANPVFPYNSSLGIYKEHHFCWYFGLQDDEKGQCTGPEVFANFLGLLDSLPQDAAKSNSSHTFGYNIPDFRYKLKRRFDRGSFGEVWLAFRWNCSQDGDVQKDSFLDSHYCSKSSDAISSSPNSFTDLSDGSFLILKRIMVERGTSAYLSGLREKYFGELFLNASTFLGGLEMTESTIPFSMDEPCDFPGLLQNNISIDERKDIDNSTDKFFYNKGKTAFNEEGLRHIARFVESFESEMKELWLVFENEGLSLSKLIYSAEETKQLTGDDRDEKARYIQVLHPSKWWHWLRTTEAGQKQMKNLIWQLLMALKACHDRNITHRDIKPENMIVCFEDMETGKCLREIPPVEKQNQLNMRIIDFGSAIDDFTMKHLYGSGPTRSEQTFEYTPPEALLNTNWFRGPESARLKYDMWSVGVVMLELILGSPHVFQISDHTRALLDQRLEGWSEHTKELAYKLRSYMEMCILIPGISSQNHHMGTSYQGGVWPAPWKCSEESFSHQVKIRDPLKIGFPDVWALRLVRQLLVWHPEDRLSVDEALSHPYFQQQH